MDFIRFPSTPHLAVLGAQDIREDKVLSDDERALFLDQEITVEEKVDGASLGISIDRDGHIRAQNRGSYIDEGSGGQWDPLWSWLTPKVDRFFDVLGDQYIVFGEWCYAVHSIKYSRLPDWFLGYDIYDRHRRRFLSVDRRNDMLRELHLHKVPVIASGRFKLKELQALLGTSAYSDEAAEGLYLRRDEAGWLSERAKLVRPDFIQTIEEHWSKRPLQSNEIVWRPIPV